MNLQATNLQLMKCVLSSVTSAPLKVALLMIFMADPDYAFLCFAQRTFAAFFATALRSAAVMVSNRRLPPILPPMRPSMEAIWEMSDLEGFTAGSVSVERRTICNAA
jgi:hypothetical protein